MKEALKSITVTRANSRRHAQYVGSHAEHPELCDRCTKVVLGL